MRLLTRDAKLVCGHQLGRVAIEPTQDLVTIDGRALLVEVDPEARSISGCPVVGPGLHPCKVTLPVRQGYSDLLKVEGRRVCLDTTRGLTDGTPPGTVDYLVDDPGQGFVSEVE